MSVKGLKKTAEGLSVKVSGEKREITVAEIGEVLEAVILPTSDLYEVKGLSSNVVSVNGRIIIIDSVEDQLKIIKEHLSVIKYMDGLPEEVTDTKSASSVIGDFLNTIGADIKDIDKEKVSDFAHKIGAKTSDLVTSVKNIDTDEVKEKARSAGVKIKGYVQEPEEVIDDIISFGLNRRKAKRASKNSK